MYKEKDWSNSTWYRSEHDSFVIQKTELDAFKVFCQFDLHSMSLVDLKELGEFINLVVEDNAVIQEVETESEDDIPF